MKRIALILIVSCVALPALAEEVGVRVGPVDATVGSARSETVVKEKVVREREPREKVIVKEKHEPAVVEKKTIIER